MEVDQCEDASNSGDSISPAELKTRRSGGGDADTKLCNGDVKQVNGQNGSHVDEEAMETDDLNGSNNDRESKNGEDETDSKSDHSRQKDNGDKKPDDNGDAESENSDGDSVVQTNGTDPDGSESKDSDVKDVKSVNDEDSKSGADDNKENESIKSDVDDSSQDKITIKSSDKDESTPASPSTDKKETTGELDKEAVELELEKELKKPSDEEIQRAAEVDQREKKLKRIEDAAKDNDDLRPVAKLLYGIGMDLGAQHIYKDLVRAQNKKQSMNKLDKRGREQLTKLKDTYKKLNKRNHAYQLKMRSCDKCGFKTESKNVIEWHLEFAHGQDEGKYECSFCDFETRLPAPFFFHMEAEHNRKGRVFMKKAFFSCPQCPYENNSKNAVTRHRLKCDKQFGLKRNQEPLPTDCDIPLKKPKSIITKRVQPASKPPAAANIQLKSYLDTRGPQQGSNIRPMTSVVRVNPSNPTVQTILSQQQARSQAASQSAMQSQRGRVMAQPAVRPGAQQIQGPGGQMYTLVNPLMVQQIPSAYTTILPQVRPTQGQGLQFVPQQQQQQQQTPQNISQIAQQVVAQVTQQHSAAQQQKAIQDILKRAQVPPASAGASNQRPGMPMTDAQAQAAAANNPKFEICEICGGFVKDRESLRIHFYWAHKVDIQKDVFARLNPHLKCDSCPQAFWTYQGLARHRQISHVKPRERSYRCYLCGAKNIENIITHLSAAHNVKLNTMYKTGKCLVCGLGFAGEKGLKRHIHTAHLELLKGTPDIGMGPGKPQLPTPSQSPKSTPLIKPQTPANKGAAPVPTGLFENSAKKKKFEPVCSLCNIVFPSVESFTMHCNKLHVFKCWRCSDKWASADLLHKHWNEKHKHEVDECTLCSDRVTIGRPMVRHMKRSHLKECSVVLVGMKKDKVKFYMDRLEDLAKKAKREPPSGAEVIVLESDEEDVEEVKKEEKPTTSGSSQEPKSDQNKSNSDKPEPATSDGAVLKSGDCEVMEVDGEKIVVQVNDDDDDVNDAQNKDEKGESSKQDS